MRRLSFSLLLILFVPVLIYGQESNPNDNLPKAKAKTVYPLKIHVSDLQLRNECSGNVALRIWSCDDVIFATATVNGKKTELMGYRIWTSDVPVPWFPAITRHGC